MWKKFISRINSGNKKIEFNKEALIIHQLSLKTLPKPANSKDM